MFARFADALDQPPPGLDAILRDDHPAVAHFSPPQRDEVRKGLAGASVRRLGGIMMGSVPASNIVYNAAANVAIALLGGPGEATRSIRARDPAFAPIAVRRYMLADRKATGDNEATPASLAAVLQRLSSRRIPGIAEATVEDIRRAILARDDPRRGRVFLKDGDLASDPITCVRTGWSEEPGGGAIVYRRHARPGRARCPDPRRGSSRTRRDRRAAGRSPARPCRGCSQVKVPARRRNDCRAIPSTEIIVPALME